jgi:hypothetical protein
MLEWHMVTKLALRKQIYNFLRRQSVKDAKKNAGKTPRNAFAFRDPGVRAARKKPVER